MRRFTEAIRLDPGLAAPYAHRAEIYEARKQDAEASADRKAWWMATLSSRPAA